jgi:hypothetical protein
MEVMKGDYEPESQSNKNFKSWGWVGKGVASMLQNKVL